MADDDELDYLLAQEADTWEEDYGRNEAQMRQAHGECADVAAAVIPHVQELPDECQVPTCVVQPCGQSPHQRRPVATPVRNSARLDVAVSLPVFVRHRLKGKQPGGSALADAVSAGAAASPCTGSAGESPTHPEGSPQRVVTPGRVHDLLRSLHLRSMREAGLLPEVDSYKQRRLAQRAAFGALTVGERGKLLRDALSSGNVPGDLIGDCNATMHRWQAPGSLHSSARERMRFLQASSGLLTYNGNWGLVKHSALPKGSPLVDLVEHLRHRADVGRWWGKFLEHTRSIAEKIHVERWSVAFELCTDTYAADGTMRIHAHLFFECGRKVRGTRGRP
jgi:hypothetical protein